MAETIKITRCDHNLVDTGEYFVVNTLTRSISHPDSNVLSLVQGDTNSEVYTIQLPVTIDAHPMDQCNKIEIHYINTGSDGEVCADIYAVEELKSYPDDDENLYAEWVLSANASKYSGNLSFAMKFMCVADDGTVLYSWSTLPFTGITVGRTITNAESVYEQYSDILALWYSKLNGASATLDDKINESVDAAKQAIKDTGNDMLAGLARNYGDYAIDEYTYYLNLIIQCCTRGTESIMVIRDIPISENYIGKSKYIYMRESSHDSHILDVYIGDDKESAMSAPNISGYATCDWYGEENNTPPVLEIQFSVQVDSFIGNTNNEPIKVTIGHSCIYDSEPDITYEITREASYLSPYQWESYVNSELSDIYPGKDLSNFENRFCIEAVKSVQPLIDKSLNKAKQYIDNHVYHNTELILYDATGNKYRVYVDTNGVLCVEPIDRTIVGGGT